MQIKISSFNKSRYEAPDHCQAALKITLIFGLAVQIKLRELARNGIE